VEIVMSSFVFSFRCLPVKWLGAVCRSRGYPKLERDCSFLYSCSHVEIRVGYRPSHLTLTSAYHPRAKLTNNACNALCLTTHLCGYIFIHSPQLYIYSLINWIIDVFIHGLIIDDMCYVLWEERVSVCAWVCFLFSVCRC
jgi:hypothetical protein